MTRAAHDAIAQAADAAGNDVWRRCKCDQFGRCLTDCPSADRTDQPAVGWYWNRHLGEWIDRG